MTHSSDRWRYRAEDGKEYGPYTYAEVREYIRQNRITVSGSLKRENSDANWMTFAEAVDMHPLMPEVLPGHPSADVPATVRFDPKFTQIRSQTSEAGYIILAVVFGVCMGLFGIHNLMAGYVKRGSLQLGLGIFGVWGLCLVSDFFESFFPSILVWSILTFWVIAEVMVVKKDGMGRPFKGY